MIYGKESTNRASLVDYRDDKYFYEPTELT